MNLRTGSTELVVYNEHAQSIDFMNKIAILSFIFIALCIVSTMQRKRA
jgi:hypothetical protein